MCHVVSTDLLAQAALAGDDGVVDWAVRHVMREDGAKNVGCYSILSCTGVNWE